MNLLTQISEAYIPWERSGFFPANVEEVDKRFGNPTTGIVSPSYLSRWNSVNRCR